MYIPGDAVVLTEAVEVFGLPVGDLGFPAGKRFVVMGWCEGNVVLFDGRVRVTLPARLLRRAG
jgi:hypothetical protein